MCQHICSQCSNQFESKKPNSEEKKMAIYLKKFKAFSDFEQKIILYDIIKDPLLKFIEDKNLQIYLYMLRLEEAKLKDQSVI